MTTILTQKVRHPNATNTWIPIFTIDEDEENNEQTVSTYGKLASSNAVNSNNIVDNAVTTAKINLGAVTTDKIDNEAVTTSKIDDGAVTAAKIDYTLGLTEQDSNIYYLQINS